MESDVIPSQINQLTRACNKQTDRQTNRKKKIIDILTPPPRNRHSPRRHEQQIQPPTAIPLSLLIPHIRTHRIHIPYQRHIHLDEIEVSPGIQPPQLRQQRLRARLAAADDVRGGPVRMQRELAQRAPADARGAADEEGGDARDGGAEALGVGGADGGKGGHDGLFLLFF